ncbi:hypothetical protein KIN20_027493 [Parelaphostrongylus tenuis]|uniref:Uncharacterized protein n=1 Tax=Parelaphostrongylus tenuis TaxID=148309 RepID=A0AAD5WDU4_PARTN|nr:hypothetical protein KIN20_027493 [Parelaphostrongylus tenuis]
MLVIGNGIAGVNPHSSFLRTRAINYATGAPVHSLCNMFLLKYNRTHSLFFKENLEGLRYACPNVSKFTETT